MGGVKCFVVGQRSSLSSGGFSLIEVLIAIGILGIVAMGMTAMMSSLARENRALSEKFDALNLEQHMLKTLSVSTFCGCLLNGNPINTASGGTNISLSRIPMRYTGACAASSSNLARPGQFADGTRLRVAAINVNNFQGVIPGSGIYSGDVVVEIDPVGLVRAIKPISFKTQIQVNMADPPGNRRIQACGSIGGDSLDQVARGVEAMPVILGTGFHDVSLPAGKFTSPPRIMIQPRWNRHSGSEGTVFWLTNITPTSFRINWHGPSGSSYPYVGDPARRIDWVAFPQ